MKAFQVINRLFLTTLCALSCFVVPSKADAIENCCEEQNECCDAGCGNWGRAALVIGSGLVAGAIAGAVSHSSSHHHHSSCCSAPSGATGPTGPTGAVFTVDSNAILTFRIDLAAAIQILGTANGDYIFTPFVSTPEGVIILGDPINLTIAGGFAFLSDTATVVVPAGLVVFGTYHVGIHLNSDGVTSSGIYRLATPDTRIVVQIDHDLLPPSEEIVNLAPFPSPVDALPTQNIQVETTYTYDPNNPNN